jgi:hypothetical protein
MKDFKTFIENLSVNENLLVPRNLEGRKEKLKQLNIKLLSQEVIDGHLKLDESFMGIDAKFVKLKKVNGSVFLEGRKWTEIPEWLKDIEISRSFQCLFTSITTLKNCPYKIGINLDCARNKLKTLEGCPENIKGHFRCEHNQLESLEGCPRTVGEYFDCRDDKAKLTLPDYVNLEGRFYN